LLPLKEEWLDGLEAVRARLQARKVTIADVTAADFRTPELMDLAEQVRIALENGPGLVLLRGWRVGEWGDEAAGLLYWELGSLLGAPRPQNARGDRIDLVMDTKSKSPHGSMNNNELTLHTDNARPPGPPRLLGLLCLRKAAQGGESLIVSRHSVHNRLLEQCPELLERLYEDFHFGRPAETYADGLSTDVGPVFKWQDELLCVRYNRYWIDLGYETIREPLSPDTRAALDTFDEILADKKMALRLLLLPGDLLLVDNRLVLHARTAFTDYENSQAR
jgi:alpha-ketoglutarate-dependent taurine dioxygenase